MSSLDNAVIEANNFAYYMKSVRPKLEHLERVTGRWYRHSFLLLLIGYVPANKQREALRELYKREGVNL